MKIINEDLCENNSKNIFGNFPQTFIKNLKKEDNAKFMEFTFEELLFNMKNEKNEKAKEYLDNNPDICQKSKWNIIKNMKYKELLEAFFLSAEFEKSIADLKNKPKNKNVDALYLENYIKYALNYTEFYSLSQNQNKFNFPPKKNIDETKDSEQETISENEQLQYYINMTKYKRTDEDIVSEIFDNNSYPKKQDFTNYFTNL